MYLERAAKNQIIEKLEPGKVILLLGPRRVGKTVILEKIKSETSESCLMLNGENKIVQEQFSNSDTNNLQLIIGESKLLILDEAQNIPNIGRTLKLMVDTFKDLKIIATGSSMFDLGNKLGEPLVGRKKTLFIYPFAQLELNKKENYLETMGRLSGRLIFGTYPDVEKLTSRDEKIEYLQELVNSYLLKDILEFDGIKNSQKLFDLIRLLAFQIGGEVSLSELGKQLSLHKDTVYRYLVLLSKVFVIYKRTGFSRNLRKEITKMDRWYFYDNGIRNAIINNFSNIEYRQDIGVLWENYVLAERNKYHEYNKTFTNSFFWRTYDQQEIELIEEKDGKLLAIETKYKKVKQKPPATWSKYYPESKFDCITSENYLPFIS